MFKSLSIACAMWCALACSSAHGQAASTTGPGGRYTPGIIHAVGPLGSAITFKSSFAAPSNHTFAWFNAGTAPVACTFQIDGSTDGIHWYALTATGNDCTAPNMLHIAYKPVDFIRVTIDSYTAAANGTDAVTFDYVRGDQ